MMARARLLFSIVLIGVTLMDGPSGSGGETDNKKKWAIAIHGGAGSDPSSWDADRMEARKQGLTRALATGRDLLAKGRSAWIRSSR